MPSKHIDDITWRKVEKESLRAVKAADKVFKETEILKTLILKGLENITDEDYEKLARMKK
tara:strand:- start:9782 stop:9961 length:180 start_codon:yes stop_codon:yes gene_type:complete